jgi:hypothetical protein
MAVWSPFCEISALQRNVAYKVETEAPAIARVWNCVCGSDKKMFCH